MASIGQRNGVSMLVGDDSLRVTDRHSRYCGCLS